MENFSGAKKALSGVLEDKINVTTDCTLHVAWLITDTDPQMLGSTQKYKRIIIESHAGFVGIMEYH